MIDAGLGDAYLHPAPFGKHRVGGIALRILIGIGSSIGRITSDCSIGSAFLHRQLKAHQLLIEAVAHH